jgi:OFA family oxalate/formate antiporter-like MFS transporter
LATGVVAAGYGFGALLTTFPIDRVIKASGYRQALIEFGAVFAVVGLSAAQGLKRPDAAWLTASPQRLQRAARPRETGTSFSPRQMLRTPIFWLLFAMMTMMSTSGLMVTSQMGAFTRDFGMAEVLVLGLPVLPLALSLDRITNGLTRPFFGWVSDRIGRENTMVIAFALEGVAMTLWLMTRSNPVLFIVMSGLVFFGWGEIFSLFPSTLTDTYGPRYGTSNYGFLYMAQGVGSVLGGPIAAILHQRTGSWLPVFQVIITMDFATALLAFFVLKPMRRRWLDASHGGAVGDTAEADRPATSGELVADGRAGRP